jgi:hypothetical protein
MSFDYYALTPSETQRLAAAAMPAVTRAMGFRPHTLGAICKPDGEISPVLNADYSDALRKLAEVAAKLARFGAGEDYATVQRTLHRAINRYTQAHQKREEFKRRVQQARRAVEQTWQRMQPGSERKAA